MAEQLYLQARRVLLDAAEALHPHLASVVLVGAQAVYVHTGHSELAVAPYTTDADLAISPVELAGAPLLGELLTRAGFTLTEQPGAWTSPASIHVDLMVPEALAGPGTRGARLGPHGKRAARRAKGLEGALVDRDQFTIASLDPTTDPREIAMWVAGPGALLVAKIHKLAERVGVKDRARDKDALDVLRLVMAVDTDDLATRLQSLLADPMAGPVADEALSVLPAIFGNRHSEGVEMAVRAAGRGEDPDTIAGSLLALIDDLRASLN